MGDARADQYWCHVCSRVVNPVRQPEIKCPRCDSGFVEEMGSSSDFNGNGIHLGSERAFSLWAPILFGLMGGLGPSRVRITNQEHIDSNSSNSQEEDDEHERETESLLRMRRRRRSSASVLHMLHQLQSGSDNSENHGDSTNDSTSSIRRGSSLILVNPNNEEALILRGHFGMNQPENPIRNAAGSIGDFLIGPGLDLLLQHLAENDSNHYGTPPAKKEAINAMPTVVIEQNSQCSICLEELESGGEAKEMPCKHKFHGDCILPWLELHSSCPVCRFQMPSDDSNKTEANGLRIEGDRMENDDARTTYTVGEGEERRENGRRYLIPVPWSFDGLFPVAGSQNGGSSAIAPSAGSNRGRGSASDTEET